MVVAERKDYLSVTPLLYFVMLFVGQTLTLLSTINNSAKVLFLAARMVAAPRFSTSL